VAASRAAHAVQFTRGAVCDERVLVGTLSLPLAGVRLEPGGGVRARLNVPSVGAGGVSLLVTLATAPRDYGRRQAYAVRVEGQEVFRAVEADPGCGVTRSFFLDLPGPRAAFDVEIAADSTTQAPITVSSLRCYVGLFSGSRQSKNANSKSEMGLALLTRQGHGYAIDAEEMRALYRLIPRSPYLMPQTAVLYNFCVRNAAETTREIDRLAALAESTNIPLRIACQIHWGGAPRGVSDGAGGTFTDLPYQQITYDPDDRYEDPGLAALMGDRYDVRFGLSVPNVWGDTPWLTFNHPRLNQLRRIRLKQALAAWRAARERLAAVGKGYLLPPELSTGEETVYWAKGVEDRRYTEINGGKPRANLMADFNPFVAADALRDGIHLDPRDGLDNNERWWLHQNLARQQQRIIDWMLEALPADPIRLTGSGPVYAYDLLRRNLYTEPYAMPLFPMKDVNPRRPGLEVGFVRDGRSGGAYWSGATMLPWLLKARERGRIALPNLECTGARGDEELRGCLQAAYACGARFATLYNWQHRADIAGLLRAFANSIEVPTGAEWRPDSGFWIGPSKIEDRESGIGNGLLREYVAPPGSFGVNRIELFRRDGGSVPVRVRVRLRDADPARASEIVLTTTVTSSPIYLPTLFPQEPGRKYVLVVEAAGDAEVDFATAADGRLAARLTADIARERARSRAIQDWQDAADLLASLRDLHARTAQGSPAREALAKAQRLFAANRPQEAYQTAIRAEQLSLPAAFDLPAPGGRLIPYWIMIQCPGGPVRVVLTAYDEHTATLTIRSAVAQTVTVRRGPTQTTATLTPDVPVEITLAIGVRRSVNSPNTNTRYPVLKKALDNLPTARYNVGAVGPARQVETPDCTSPP